MCNTQHGSAFTGRGRSDLWAVVEGVPFIIEVKAAVGVTSPKQAQYIKQARKAGACAFVTRDPHSALRAVKLRLKGKEPYMSGLEELDLSFMEELEKSLGTEPDPESGPRPGVGPTPESVPAALKDGYEAMENIVLGEGQMGYDELIELVRELVATVKLLVEIQQMQIDLYVSNARAVVSLAKEAPVLERPAGTSAQVGFPPFNLERHIQETEPEKPKRRRRSQAAED